MRYFSYLIRFHKLPTCVGKIDSNGVVADSVEAHPHMRGENGTEGRGEDGKGAHPPHAWGK